MLSESPLLVYFSSVSENTHRFAQKVEAGGIEIFRLPLKASEASQVLIERPYVLAVPTYGGGKPGQESPRYTPIQVKKFLSNKCNRDNLQAVIGMGNTNFYTEYGIAADIISAKMNVPVAMKIELLGTSEEVQSVIEGMKRLWNA